MSRLRWKAMKPRPEEGALVEESAAGFQVAHHLDRVLRVVLPVAQLVRIRVEDPVVLEVRNGGDDGSHYGPF